MSGSKHRQMLSPVVLSVLDSLSPDKAPQTDERQAMLLGFEAMCGELFISNHRIPKDRKGLENTHKSSYNALCISITHCSTWLLIMWSWQYNVMIQDPNIPHGNTLKTPIICLHKHCTIAVYCITLIMTYMLCLQNYVYRAWRWCCRTNDIDAKNSAIQASYTGKSVCNLFAV